MIIITSSNFKHGPIRPKPRPSTTPPPVNMEGIDRKFEDILKSQEKERKEGTQEASEKARLNRLWNEQLDKLRGNKSTWSWSYSLKECLS